MNATKALIDKLHTMKQSGWLLSAAMALITALVGMTGCNSPHH